MIKEKLTRAEYIKGYKRKERAAIKADPKILPIFRNGYILTLIEVQKIDRQGIIENKRIRFDQPAFDNKPNMALKSCKPIKSK